MTIFFVFSLVVTPSVETPPLQPNLANPLPSPTTHPPSSMRSFPKNPSKNPPNLQSLRPQNRNLNPQLLHHLKGLAVHLSTPLNRWQNPQLKHLTNPTLVEIPLTFPQHPPLLINLPPICRLQHLQSRLLTLQVSGKSWLLLLLHLGMWFGENCYKLDHINVLWRCWLSSFHIH